MTRPTGESHPPTMAALLEKSGNAHQWWGMIAAFLIDAYRATPVIRWETVADAWGVVYRRASVTLASVVPYGGYLIVFIPFSIAAVKRTAKNPTLLDQSVQGPLRDYLSGKTATPRVLVVTDEDVDAVTRLVSVAHPRKGHPCGSL